MVSNPLTTRYAGFPGDVQVVLLGRPYKRAGKQTGGEKKDEFSKVHIHKIKGIYLF